MSEKLAGGCSLLICKSLRVWLYHSVDLHILIYLNKVMKMGSNMDKLWGNNVMKKVIGKNVREPCKWTL